MCILLYVSFIWLHVYAFAIHSMVHCGSAFESGAFELPWYCASICACSCCTWRATVWIQKQNNKLCGGKKIGIRVWRQNISKKKVIYSTMFIVLCYGYMYDSLNTRISGPAGDLGMWSHDRKLVSNFIHESDVTSLQDLFTSRPSSRHVPKRLLSILLLCST